MVGSWGRLRAAHRPAARSSLLSGAWWWQVWVHTSSPRNLKSCLFPPIMSWYKNGSWIKSSAVFKFQTALVKIYQISMYLLTTCSKSDTFSAGIYWNMNHLLRGKREKKQRESHLKMCRWANWNLVLLWAMQPPLVSPCLPLQRLLGATSSRYPVSSSDPYALGSLCHTVQNVIISSTPTFSWATTMCWVFNRTFNHVAKSDSYSFILIYSPS